ncbi:MAG: DUF5655 domain-containing protein [Ilumatobacteraceae bacterium]
MTIDDYFSTGPPFERPIFEAVLDVVSSVGPVHVEPVSVGIFIKKTGSFLELRPKTRWVALSFPLGRTVQHSQISRKPIVAGNRVYHHVNLSSPDDVTPAVESWLAESYRIAD